MTYSLGTSEFSGNVSANEKLQAHSIMYQPSLFREERIEVMHELMQAHPFATLVSSVSGELTADHLPLVVHPELSEKGIIRGHVAKGNPLWLNRSNLTGVLAVFQGPQAYVTPSWYPSKKQHGKVVPTWNYAVVHAHGELEFLEDDDWLMEHLTHLTKQHESHRPVPWKVTDAPKDFMARQLRGIVGIELTIGKLEGKWKVSQNRDEQDRIGVQRGLLAESRNGATAVSDLVGKTDK
ncbi:MAG: FMN-binding negative transcriptional regulator [Fimbriimonadaceae bacterium]|nr:FMN-binding negative transcriptional regulator [Alphaproteobacteria bacterium]